VTIASLENRLAKLRTQLPQLRGEPQIPPELWWFEWTAFHELDELASIAEAMVDRDLDEIGQLSEVAELRWIEIEAAARRRHAEGWSKCDGPDKARYVEIDRGFEQARRERMDLKMPPWPHPWVDVAGDRDTNPAPFQHDRS
jgi:hypothetical protein